MDLDAFDGLMLFMTNNEKFVVLGLTESAQAHFYSHSSHIFLLIFQRIMLIRTAIVPTFFKKL